jgi:thiamine biosynthesis lipoprotein
MRNQRRAVADRTSVTLHYQQTGLMAARRFRVFNTDVTVMASDWMQAPILARVERQLYGFEARFSRFLPDSELTRFNQRAEPCVEVSCEMLALLQRCVELYRDTGGIFNPLVLPNLEAAGYGRSFEQLGEVVDASDEASVVPALEVLQLDATAGTALLPLGLKLDFGGIGKGYAVDQAATLFRDGAGFLLDAGGDIYASGSAPEGPWTVGVADPARPEGDLCVLTVRDQAVATSSTLRRRWQARDGARHHIIDPRTGRPAESDVVSATVIAPTATEADVFAKAALILGSAGGTELLENHGYEGLLVLDGGALRRTAGWPGN